MGLLQKNKRNGKGVKHAIPVPPCWTKRTAIVPNTTPPLEGQEAKLMASLMEDIKALSSSTGPTWLEQSKQLKQIEKYLKQIERLDGVSSFTLGYIRDVIIPLTAECFFLPDDVVVRRQAIPIIKTMSALDPSALDYTLRAELLAYIGSTQDLDPSLDNVDIEFAAGVYERQSVSQKAQTIQVLANIPVGFPIIRRHIGDILGFCVGALEVALSKLQNPQAEQSSLEQIALQEDCAHTARAAFLLVSKSMSYESKEDGAYRGDLLQTILDGMHAAESCKVDAMLVRLYEHSWSLVACSAATLEARQVAAMILVLLVEGSGLPSDAERASMVAHVILNIDTVDSQDSSESEPDTEGQQLPEVGFLSHDTAAAGWRDQAMGDAVSMLCIARAVVSVAACSTTLAPLNIDPESSCAGVVANVHEAVFTHIASVCGRSQLAPGVKAMAFESMASWLEYTAALLVKCTDTDAPKVSYADAALSLGRRVLVQQRERIMGYLWSYWDDPLDAVQNKVRAIFETFLDIGSAMNRAALQSDTQGLEVTQLSSDAFLSDVLELILTMDWSRKVKYSLLATLCPRISIKTLFAHDPALLTHCFDTLEQVMMAPKVANLLSAILARSREEIACLTAAIPESIASAEVEMRAEDLQAKYIEYWIDPTIEKLSKDSDTARRMLVQHVLPNLFQTFPVVVSILLRGLTQKRSSIIGQYSGDTSFQHALIVVLKVARSQDLVTIEQLARAEPTTANSQSDSPLIDMLSRAARHPDWTVRADLLGLLCESRKLVTAPSQIEYDLLFKLLRASASATSADFRQQQFSALTALATRLVTASTHAHRIITTGKPPVPSQKVRHREKARIESAVAAGKAQGKSEAQVLRELGIVPQDERVARARQTLDDINCAVHKWLDFAVRGCLYPGAGFAKVATGLRWLEILTAFFTPGRPAQAPEGSTAQFAVPALGSPDFLAETPQKSGNVSAREVVMVLTQVLFDDPFDANRAKAFALLTNWPLLSSDGSVQGHTIAWARKLLRKALKLATSTRAGESESGALVVRWLFRKFVVAQHAALHIDDDSNEVGSVAFARELLDLIRKYRDVASKNLLDAAQEFPLHGLLTAAKYVVEEIEFAARDVQDNAALWRELLNDMARVSFDISNIVLDVLTSASPEGNIPMSYREIESRIDDVADISGLEGAIGPRQQVILSYCWRAVKEVAGLLSAIATVPPGSELDTVSFIDEELVGEIGSQLRTLLTSIRHRGAFSAVYPAFTEVCARMYKSPSVTLNAQIGAWLDQCLDIVTICKVSVTRRSAGWPLCLLSILTCDKRATQALLPRAMERIFDIASDLQSVPTEDTTVDLPQVHAINMLRVLLGDRSLSSDIIPYIEHAFVLSLTGLRSRHWVIRNVCGLLYAALTRRVFGANKARTETVYDGITGRELFTRFPGLHPFLTNQLEDAIDQMSGAMVYDDEVFECEMQEPDPLTTILRSGAQYIHPALYPCLTLLARLQPSPKEIEKPTPPAQNNPALAAVVAMSPHSESASLAVAPPMNLDTEPLTRLNERNSTVHVTSASTMLSVYTFTELVELCLDSPVFKTREMAARAFAPLLPADEAPAVVLSIIEHIASNETTANQCHGMLCQLQELLRVHWRITPTDHMKRVFVNKILPELVELWAPLVFGTQAEPQTEVAFTSDIVRHKYLEIVNEYVVRGESWVLAGLDGDSPLAAVAEQDFALFRREILHKFIHPLLVNRTELAKHSQIPGAYATVLELTRALVTCIEHDIEYDPWPAINAVLGAHDYYESQIVVLEWLDTHAITDHALINRVGAQRLIARLVVETHDPEADTRPSRDPIVRSASIRLLAKLCATYEIYEFPESDIMEHWKSIEAQLSDESCAVSVAAALVQYQASIISIMNAPEAACTWADRVLAWADPEMSEPYRRASSASAIAYRTSAVSNTSAFSACSETILFAVWKLLQDDDAEIRESLARVVASDLACDQACESLITSEQRSASFALRCFELLEGPHAIADSSRALFEHEKPNIYIDELRNAQLAYYTIVTCAGDNMLDRALACVEKLESADVAGVSDPEVFLRVQAWILGARAGVIIASRSGDKNAIARIEKCMSEWTCAEHPWVVRAAQAVAALAGAADDGKGGVRQIGEDEALDDLFLLTYIQ